ncbi:MAG: ATP-binding cassette domain-containing protein [Desulfobacterales bacterium]
MHLLKLKNLKIFFLTFEGVANAGDDVSFYLDKGEVLGVVGESGCGKNVTTQSIMRLFPSGREPRSALSLIPQTQD